jgi:hypothetical protein
MISRTAVARRAGYWCRSMVSEPLSDSRNRVGPNGLLVYQMKVSGVHHLSLTNTYDSFGMATEVVAQRAGIVEIVQDVCVKVILVVFQPPLDQ